MNAQPGHHDTTVHEQAAPAVKHETVKPTRHEEIKTSADKEIHQDHYHRAVQPIQDTEVLPEQHKRRVAGTEHREFDHRNQEATEQALRAESGKLHDQRVVTDTTKTQSRAPAVQNERFHHHVHEVVQPLIQKDVIQPEVVHTTVPVHEVHHLAASHHPTTSLPAVSMDEYKRQGGTLSAVSGSEQRTKEFEGCPTGVSTHQQGENIKKSSSASTSSGKKGQGIGSADTKEKPGIIDKLNPFKDSDGDGKSGFMT